MSFSKINDSLLLLAVATMALGISNCSSTQFGATPVRGTGSDATKAPGSSVAPSGANPSGTTTDANQPGAGGLTAGATTGTATTGTLGNGADTANTGTPGAIGADGSNGGGDGLSETDTVLSPQSCDTVTSGKKIHVGDKCPEDSALYTMDDMGSHDAVPGVYACCPLPAHDILLKANQYQARSVQCQADEVMTGTIDTNGNIYCTKINTARYSLRPGTVAFTGQGSSGGGGPEVAESSLPATLHALVIGPLGSDGCVALPFGSLIVRQGGRKCTDTAAATLYEISSGAPVKMFPDQ